MKHSLKEWFFATRPWGYSASIIPAMVALSYIFYEYHLGNVADINWWFGVLAVVGAAIFQAAGNVLSEYFDFKYKVDQKETVGSSKKILVEGTFTPKEILYFGLSILTVGSLIGIFFLFNVSINILWIGIIGVIGTYYYYAFKFRALGDLNIFIVYGLTIAIGTYLVMSNKLNWEILFIASSTGFLIVNILHANNIRDIKYDRIAKIKTQAMLLGVKKSILLYEILSYGAYAIILISVLTGLLHWITLIVFVTIPMLMKNIKKLKSAEIEKPENIQTLDAETAQHLTLFGGILIIANFVAGFIV